jgi:hypothetical protein
MIKLGSLVDSKAFGKFEQGKVYSNPYATAFAPQPTIKEAEDKDHEVSMAQNSLDAIIKNATELKTKIGEMEKNIPGWIQDHITNSENYIEQANSGYHELTEGKVNEMGPNDVHFKQVMNFYDKGSASTKKAISIFVSGKPNANRNKIVDDLGDMGYDEILDVVDHFKLDEACWKGYKQIGMKDKGGRQVPNCVPESVVKEGRGVKSIQNDFNKTISAIQSELEAFKSSKGTPKAQKHVENLKKLNAVKAKLEKELEDSVSSLYRNAELKIED